MIRRLRPVPPSRLVRLASDLAHPNGPFAALAALPADAPCLRPRSFGAIAAEVGGDRPVSALEWAMFVRHPTWSRATDADGLARRTWDRARRTPALRAVLVGAVAQVVLREAKGAADALVRTLSPAPGDETLELLDLARRKDDDALASRCLASARTPNELFRARSLPPPSGGRCAQIAHGCIRAFVATGTRPTYGPFVLRLLEQSPTPTLIVELVRGIPADSVDKHAALRDAVLTTWGPASPRFSALPEEARQGLREWAGSVVFTDFRRIIDTMVASTCGDLQDHDRRRLKSRGGFWAAYQGRFLGLRVLLPRRRVEALGLQRELQRPGVQLLGPGEQVVTCLIDFGTHILVEVFEGAGEVRVIEQGRRQLWSTGAELGLDAIRRLPVRLAHDHLFLWQPSLHRALTELGIRPSPGVTRYEAAEKSFPFSVEPTVAQHKQRQRGFQRWLEDFIRSLPQREWSAEELQAMLNTWSIDDVRSAMSGSSSSHAALGTVKFIHEDGYGFIDLGAQHAKDVFVPPQLVGGLSAGDAVQVAYRRQRDGRLRATSVERR